MTKLTHKTITTSKIDETVKFNENIDNVENKRETRQKNIDNVENKRETRQKKHRQCRKQT
jgi:hypothetical protein